MELAFFIGLLSALHCFGMCGGIVGALTMSLPSATQQNNIALLKYAFAYNAGRIISYCLAGVVVGLVGETIISFTPEIGGILLRLLFLIFIILLGFYVGGWLPKLALIEKLGQPIWKKLQPIGMKYLPVKKIRHAFMFGLVWGWLPCGLVYYALLMALSQTALIDSVLFMLAFGLGTLFPMLLASILAGKLSAMQHSKKLRQFNASALIIIGLVGLLMLLFPEMTHPLHYSK